MFFNQNNLGHIKASMDRMTELREKELQVALEKEEKRKAKKLAKEEKQSVDRKKKH